MVWYFLFNLYNSCVIISFFNLSTSKSSISDFKFAKSAFLVNFDISMRVAPFESDFDANLDKSNLYFVAKLDKSNSFFFFYLS